MGCNTTLPLPGDERVARFFDCGLGPLLLVKAINRAQRLASKGLDQLRSVTSSKDET